MHDPSTLAFNINIPLPWKTKTFWKDGRKDWAKYSLCSIWHTDPCRDGTDDSCGWFPRARHGDKAILEKIVKRFAEDWDRVWATKPEDHDPDDGPFRSKVYFCGLFCPNGDPHMSVHGIVLNLFFIAASEHFQCDGRSNWRKAKQWMRRNLLDIMLLAENPSDSLFDSVTLKFRDDNKQPTPRDREQRIRDLSGIIYGWILRRERPWWKHPKWHIHHWKIQVPVLQSIRRWAFVRCSKCGGRFSWGESAMGSWGGQAIWHQGCDSSRAK